LTQLIGPQVSRRWHALLRSSDVWKRRLTAWNDGPLNISDDYDHYATKAKSIHRFRNGNPSDIVTETIQNPVIDRRALSALVEETFVQTLEAGRALLVVNLRTRTSWKTQGDAREHIIAVATSDCLVAYTTSINVCYVADLRGDRRAKFKFLPSMAKVLACSGPVVVCAGPSSDAVEFYLWNFDEMRGKSFRVGHNQSPFIYRAPR
jgi:hypothetical protein